MKLQQFLDHYNLAENPFAHEDAKDDDIFRRHLIDGTHHPAWDKIFGPPDHPSTSVVFGEQGSGKTALRLQMVDQIRRHNAGTADNKVLVVEYDDLDPFLDTLRENIGRAGKTPEKTVKSVKLHDHMDAILSLATSRLLDIVNGNVDDSEKVSAERIKALTPLQRRDTMVLAALYDRSYDQSPRRRWRAIRKRVGYSTWKTWWDVLLGVVVTLLALLGLGYYLFGDSVDAGSVNVVRPVGGEAVVETADKETADASEPTYTWLPFAIAGGIALLGWLPYLWHRMRLFFKARKIAKRIRVLDKRPSDLRRILAKFSRDELLNQPLPTGDSADPRYELFHKLSGVLRALGFKAMLVIIDRVDEPHLVNGQAERIRDVLWPLLDHKFLSTDDVAFKMLLPKDVTDFLDRESADFHQRSRLDKRNLVKSLEWSGQSLYDITNDRLRACTRDGEEPITIDQIFDASLTTDVLIDRFARLRLPRHLFKFLYRLLVDHCSKFTEQEPDYTISRDTVESQLALFTRDLDAYSRGRGAG